MVLSVFWFSGCRFVVLLSCELRKRGRRACCGSELFRACFDGQAASSDDCEFGDVVVVVASLCRE